MTALHERLQIAAEILEGIGGQSAMAATVREAATALQSSPAQPSDAKDAARYQELREAVIEHEAAVHKLESLTNNRAPVCEARRIAIKATHRLRAALAIDTAAPAPIEQEV